MQLIFARHGESQANVEKVISNRDLPHYLTARGRKQAAAMGGRLADMGIQEIYSSPIPRAQETARIVAERLGLSVQTADALKEVDCGILEGRGDQAAWQAYDEMLRQWDELHDHDYRIEGGESLNQVKRRFEPFIKALTQKSPPQGSGILLISHGNTLQHMLPVVLSNLGLDYLERHPLGTCGYLAAGMRQGKLAALLAG